MIDARRTAIVCDDDPLMRSVFAKLLGHAGHEVIGAFDNAVDAINVARLMHPDVVILDVSLNGMSGLDALPDLVLVAPGCRIVVCTSFDNVRQDALDAGATVVVDKAELSRLPWVIAGLRGGQPVGGNRITPLA